MEGRHVKILGRGSAVLLASQFGIRGFLKTLVEELGMRMLGVEVYDVKLEVGKLGVEPFEDEGGVTGFAVLSTSHCSIHTWPLRLSEPEREMFVLDVFSCRDFDVEIVLAMLFERFKATDLVIRAVDLSYTL